MQFIVNYFVAVSCSSGSVVDCETRDCQIAGQTLAAAALPPRSAQLSIYPALFNE